MWSINNEKELNSFLNELRSRGSITLAEQDMISSYVCGIFDALSGLNIYEEDLM